MPITVGILEDDPDLRPYLVEVVGKEEGVSVAFAAETLAEAEESLRWGAPDICLVDLQLPDGNGSQFIRDLKREYEGAKALVLTALGDKASVLVAFEAGANGYLLKDTPPDQILRDIRAVIEGGNPISPQAARHLLGLLSLGGTTPEDSPPPNTLTPREQEVLTLFAKGMSYAETAKLMDVSTHTVGDYVKGVYRKLSVHSKSEAIFEAVQNGWLDL